MAVSGISAAGSHAGHHATQSLASHKHGGQHAHSLSDIDAKGSSIASPASNTGKIGSKINITA
jgi:hypothetical protein